MFADRVEELPDLEASYPPTQLLCSVFKKSLDVKAGRVKDITGISEAISGYMIAEAWIQWCINGLERPSPVYINHSAVC